MDRLETERLILRDWTIEDRFDLYDYAKSELVGPNAGWKPHESVEESIKIIEMFMAQGDVYAIELKAENKVIGGIGLHKRIPDESLSELKQLEVGYVLNPNYWGQGIMPEAVAEVKKYAFETLDLDLLWCAHFDFNEKSKRVIEKTGFVYQFSKKKTLDLLDGREVTTLFYKIENPLRREQK